MNLSITTAVVSLTVFFAPGASHALGAKDGLMREAGVDAGAPVPGIAHVKERPFPSSPGIAAFARDRAHGLILKALKHGKIRRSGEASIWDVFRDHFNLNLTPNQEGYADVFVERASGTDKHQISLPGTYLGMTFKSGSSLRFSVTRGKPEQELCVLWMALKDGTVEAAHCSSLRSPDLRTFDPNGPDALTLLSNVLAFWSVALD